VTLGIDISRYPKERTRKKESKTIFLIQSEMLKEGE
jgi:hypothetical protein